MKPHPTARLGKVADIIRGVSFEKSEAVESAIPDYLPILRAGNIRETLHTDNDLVWVPKRKVADAQRLRVLDVVICMSSGSASVVGKTALLETDWQGSVGAFCAIIRFHSIHPRFGALWLRSPGYRAWRDAQAQGANIQNLRKAELEDLELPVPSGPEQERIVRIMDEVETLRRLRSQADHNMERFAAAEFAATFESARSMRQGWPEKCMEQVLAAPLQNGVSPASEGTNADQVLTLSAITGPVFDAQAVKPALFARLPESSKRVKAGQFLICRGNGNFQLVGSGKFATPEAYGFVFPDTMISAEFDPGQVVPEFIDAIWRTSLIRSQIQSNARTTNGTFKINQANLGLVSFPVPPIDLQKSFAARVGDARSLGVVQIESRKRLDHLFNSLLARAFKGEL